MGKPANPKRIKENEAKASAKYIRISPQKLNLVAQTIRGKSAATALIDLEFSKKRVSESVRKLLQAAVANAVNNHNLDADRLVVAEAHVGKSVIMKRFRARAKGRGTRILKPISNMTIILKEADEA
ncbi:MAG: 50S ribosomal protein L22 [Alphaproteobacteria bacterium]|nr:50S ribosomal protein L22 [Alphaproteobacteria bacterium]